MFTINPNWTSSILPPKSFRIPSPGSIFGYTGAQKGDKSYTSDYAYFQRDSRRSFPTTLSVTKNSVTGLLPVVEKDERIGSKLRDVPVPGKRRVYKQSDEQPLASGYFPITNYE